MVDIGLNKFFGIGYIYVEHIDLVEGGKIEEW